MVANRTKTKDLRKSIRRSYSFKKLWKSLVSCCFSEKYECIFFGRTSHKNHRFQFENGGFSNFLVQNGEAENEVGVSFGVSFVFAVFEKWWFPNFFENFLFYIGAKYSLCDVWSSLRVPLIRLKLKHFVFVEKYAILIVKNRKDVFYLSKRIGKYPNAIYV